ncbi:MAG: hypothetical protein AB8H80_11305 [Planctomycetota bacterium]
MNRQRYSLFGFAKAGLLCAGLLTANTHLAAQATLIVNVNGGPGVFTTLAGAVAAASDGDTILVQPSLGPVAEGFTTDKGLTIIGEDLFVGSSSGSNSPFRVENLPATSTFRMVGFGRVSNGTIYFEVDNCAGQVHLESMRAREHENGPTFHSALKITNSDNVTLREFNTYGTPAVEIQSSTVSLVRCQLGRTHIGLGGGACMVATNSVVDVVEPRFDTNWGAPTAIELNQSDLRLVGSSASFVRNPTGPAITANGGTIVIAPAVVLTALSAAQTIVGTASVTQQTLPGTSTGDCVAGQTLDIETSAPAGARVWHAIGAPGFLTPSPLGTLGIDPTAPYAFLPLVTVPPSGAVTSSLSVPAALPVGSTYTAQAVVFSGALELSLPCTFVVR